MILDKRAMHPFDAQRGGVNLGEGAAFVVLESEEMVAKFNKKPLVELTGYSNSNDAFHQTASSPDGDGALLSMSRAIAMAGVELKAVDYINCHGTGTENNDLSPNIVGEPIAAHTRPDQIRFKKLYVLVHNSVWLQQLTFLKPVLLEKVNAKLAGQPLVTDIVLRIGEFTTDPSPTAEATTAPDPLTIQPSPQLLQEVTLDAQGIQDQALPVNTW